MVNNKQSVAIGVGMWFLLFFLTLMYAPFTIRFGATEARYKDVLTKANIKGETKVTNIAMLGAHDAFSHKINLLSKPDPAESGIVANKAVNIVFKGGLTRVLKAQQASAKTLLNRGVRYFDVRISYYEGKWYTKHGLLDQELKYYVGDIYNFLKDKPKEFIIFDIQHIYLGNKTMNDFMDYFSHIVLKNENLVLNDFINHPRTQTLSELEYVEVQGTNHGGIILLLNDDGTISNTYDGTYFTRGNGEGDVKSIRSKWHNKQTVNAIIPLIDEEAVYLKNEATTAYFRVNQAQLTPDYVTRPLGTLWDWSLINLAAKSNRALLSHKHFDEWLAVMPIFMVDFANSNSGNFNTRINEKMIIYNSKL